MAQTAGPAPRPEAPVSIAPGTPATVGREGALTGVVPGQTVPAPSGVMETLRVQRPSTGPVDGANSFTEREAQRRIEAGGFTEVTGLKQDAGGVWRGKGMRSGAAVDVFCNYQGNVGAL